MIAARPKGYLVVTMDVTDPEEYAKYTAHTPDLIKAAGGRFLVRGGAQEPREGSPKSRTVVVEFADVDAAKAFYDSPAYQAILPHAFKGAVRDLVVVEGYLP